MGSLLVGARANVPVIDDWVYAWSVEHLVATGRLQVLEFSAIYPISQILWGALFVRLAGFSFGVLRLSTLALSVMGCWAVYLTLREMGCRQSTSLLGALALALNPVYFALSFSFMTEVPFVSLSSMAVYCYVRAIRRDDVRSLWAGGFCAVAAFLVRPLAFVLPISILPAVIGAGNWRSAVRRAAAPLAVTLATMVVLQIALPRMLGPLQWAAIRQDQMRWWFLVPIQDYARWTLGIMVVSVFPLAPLLLPHAARWRGALQVGVAAVVLLGISWMAVGRLIAPLPNSQTWSLQEITARAMVDGSFGPSAWSERMVPLLECLGVLTLASLAVISVKGWARAGWGRIELVIMTLGVLHIAAIHLLWLYNDRYYAVLTPVWAIIGARALDLDGRAKWMAAALLALWAGIDVTGTRDMLAFNRACAQAAQELEASGIPPWEIDAGYVLNGWRLYAHPEHLKPGADRRYGVPYVTSKELTPYSITNAPPPDADVIRVIPLPEASWQASHTLYVIRRR